MSKKRSNSTLPDDSFTFTDGSNYGLDGFNFDLEYNEGVLDKVRLPEVQGLAGLPDGLVTSQKYAELPEDVGHDGSAGVGDLGTFLKEGSLADLDWLEFIVQDPDRLPKSSDSQIENLEKAWGVDRRTTGLELLPNKEKEFLEEKPTKKSSEDLLFVAQKAMRKASYGVPLDKILKEAAQELEYDAPRLKQVMAALREEYGLLGNVYLRASSFPGCQNGKWTSAVKKKASAPKYIIAKPKCAGCVFAQEGSCSVFKKTLVEDVSWDKAYKHYASRLKAAGYDLQKDGSKRSILKKAFLEGPQEKRSTQDSKKPILPNVLNQITLKEAQAQFQQMPEQKQEKVRALTTKWHTKAKNQLLKWKKAGLLTKEQLENLISSNHDPKILLKQASQLVVEAKESSQYKGSGLHYARKDEKVSSEQIVDELSNAPEVKTSSSTQYQGSGFLKEKVASEAEIQESFAKSRSLTLNPNQLQKMLRWASQQMNEGFLGDELSQLLEMKFSKPALKLASEPLNELRDAHEGLAGHLYVDASVYASEIGTRGCDKGSLKHRTNGIKYVKAMDRCGSCVYANSDNVCQKYKKRLATEFPGSEKYQRDMIRLANASDAEQTASYFAPVSNPVEEFGLYNDSLDKISFDVESTPKQLSDVLFGGLYVEVNDD